MREIFCQLVRKQSRFRSAASIVTINSAIVQPNRTPGSRAIYTCVQLLRNATHKPSKNFTYKQRVISTFVSYSFSPKTLHPLGDPSLVGGSLHSRTGSNRMGAPETRPHQFSGQRSATRETFPNVKQGPYDVWSRAAKNTSQGSVPTTVPKSASVLPRRPWLGRVMLVARVTVEKAYAKAYSEQNLLMRLRFSGSTCGRKAEGLGFQL